MQVGWAVGYDHDDTFEVRNCDIDKFKGVFLIGYGTGEAIRWLLRKYGRKMEIHVACYDKTPFMNVDFPYNVKLICGEDKYVWETFHREIMRTRFPYILVGNVYKKYKKENPDSFSVKQIDAIEATKESSMSPVMKMLEANTFMNLREIEEGRMGVYKELWNKHQGRTAYVLGAGPSLSKAMGLIEKGDIVIAAGQVLPIWYNNEQPFDIDYVTYVDFAAESKWGHFGNGKYVDQRHTFICCQTTACNIPVLYENKYMGITDGYSYINQFDRFDVLEQHVGIFRHMVTVTSYSIDIAARMGCSKIILMGFDCGNVIGGKVHADGYESGFSDAKANEQEVGVSGEICETTINFRADRDWAERFIKDNPNIEVVNYTTALKIEGAENIDAGKMEYSKYAKGFMELV